MVIPTEQSPDLWFTEKDCRTSPPSRRVPAPPWTSGARKGAERPSRPLGPRSAFLAVVVRDFFGGNADVDTRISWDYIWE